MDPLVDAILLHVKSEVKEEANAECEAPPSTTDTDAISNNGEQQEVVMQSLPESNDANEVSDYDVSPSVPSETSNSNRKGAAKKKKGRARSHAKSFTCTACGFSTPYAQVLQRHMRRHTGQKPYKCDLCEKAFSLLVTLNRHRSSHFSEKPFKCSHCEFSCNQKSNLYSHERTHFEERRLQCPHCPKKLANQKSLRNHIAQHSDAVYACDRCGHEAKSEAALYEHKRYAKCTREATLKCDYCDYRTHSEYLLCEHLQRRNASTGRCRPRGKAATATYYTCSTCRFTTPSKLRYEQHLRRRVNNRCREPNRKRILPSAPLMFMRAQRRFNFVDSKGPEQDQPGNNKPERQETKRPRHVVESDDLEQISA